MLPPSLLRPLPSPLHRAAATLLLLATAACGSGGGGGAGGGGGGGGGGAPPDASALMPTSGLVSLAAGDASAAADDGVIQARWDGRAPNGSAVAVALFLSTSKATLFAGPPVATDSGQGSTVLAGLTEDQPFWVGLALDLGGGEYQPVGAQMTATPGLVFYVDAASTAVSPDGSSPAQAFPNLLDAVLVASSFGGIGAAANVWVAAGDYSNVAAPLFAGVHVYGGFDPTFDLASRDPLGPNRSVLHALAGSAAIEIQGGDLAPVLDGFEIDGVGSTFGIDIDTSAARLSSLVVRDCTGRGVRARSLSTTANYRVTLARCSVVASGAQGLSLEGSFRLEVEGCRFSVNGLEGIDLNDLIAPDGLTASLSVRDSTFFGNGEEGLDCDLGAPAPGGTGSRYDVRLEGSRFERNGWKSALTPPGGVLIDIEFEGFPGWSADIVVRGCVARANRGNGVHLDLDSTSRTFVHRLLSIANGGDGLRVTSETTTSLANASACVLAGNLGAGARALAGNVPLVLAHCVIAGNAQGGCLSETVESSASSCVTWLQATPFGGAGGVRQRADVVVADALDTTFVRAPVDYRSATAFDGTNLTLSSTAGLAVSDALELADDGIVRTITGFVGGTQVTLSSPPATLDLPALVVRFASAATAVEDWSLAVGSPAEDAGMPPPSLPAPDAGVFGAPLGGAPGPEEVQRPALFFADGTTPPTTTVLGPSQAMRVHFSGGDLDSLSIAGNVQVRLVGGGVIATGTPALSGTDLLVPAPGGGWPSGSLTLELFGGLETIDTPPVGLATPIALPFRVP